MPDSSLRQNVRRAPTHELTIRVPLFIPTADVLNGDELQQAMAEALDAVLRLVKLGTLGLLCNDPQVTFEESGGGEHEHLGEPFEDDR